MSPASDIPKNVSSPTKSALKPSQAGSIAASAHGCASCSALPTNVEVGFAHGQSVCRLSETENGDDPKRRQYLHAMATSLREAATDHKSLEEYSLAKVKSRLLLEWHPEYEPESAQTQASADASLSTDIQQQYTVSERATLIQLQDIVDDSTMTRKTKVICTLGPACSTHETLGALVDAGLNVARLNFSHGSHESHLEMLNLFRYRVIVFFAQTATTVYIVWAPGLNVTPSGCPWEAMNANRFSVGRQYNLSICYCRSTCDAKAKLRAVLLDTKGPEIRTAMLHDGKDIQLEQGQEIIVEAVGDRYVSFQGHKTDEETRIGLSYDKLCQSVVPGNRILVADGTISIEVLEIMSDTELRGKVLNSKALGQRKNCNLPGVKVELPVLMDKVCVQPFLLPTVMAASACVREIGQCCCHIATLEWSMYVYMCVCLS